MFKKTLNIPVCNELIKLMYVTFLSDPIDRVTKLTS